MTNQAPLKTLNHTIATAEREVYLTLLNRAKTRPIANEWLANLPRWLSDIKDKRKYAHAPAYLSSVQNLPNIKVDSVDLNSDALTINARLNTSQNKQITALLKQLMPWRKGPFQIGVGDNNVFIDTEWRSDWKWNRIAPHIGSLEGRHILDVGGGSGYHGWRMVGAGAKQVIVIDPSCLFYHQFMAIRHFIGLVDADINANLHDNAADIRNTGYRIHYIPVGLEALPSSVDEGNQLFDMVFSMGVLYHRQSPFEHLNQLKNQLIKGGQLILETLVIEGGSNSVLVPHSRYAKMNNVYFIPSVKALIGWLEKVGFSEVRCVDVNTTSINEQRATDWMTYQSLSDFLDPDDSSRSIEGYPAPIRATLIATK